MLIGALAVIAILTLGGFWYLSDVQQAQFIGREKDCSIAPTIGLSVFDADEDKAGTAITGYTTYIRVNGVYLGSATLNGSSATTFAYGDNVEVLVDKNGYLDTSITVDNLDCGKNYATARMYATSTNSFRIFNTDGTSRLTDSATGGAVNQSSSSATMNFPIHIDSTVDESTGDLVIVVETNTTEVDTISLSGLGGASSSDTPGFYSAQGSSPTIDQAFEVPAILDGASVSGTLTLNPESGQTIGASGTAVYVTAYSKQEFVDNDGTFGYGVEDSRNNAKYENTWDHDFYIV